MYNVLRYVSLFIFLFFQLSITFSLCGSEHRKERAFSTGKKWVSQAVSVVSFQTSVLLIIFSVNICWMPKRMLVHRRMWFLKCNLWIINIQSSNFHYSWVILFKISNYMLDFRSFTRPLILLYWNIFSWGKSVDSFL